MNVNAIDQLIPEDGKATDLLISSLLLPTHTHGSAAKQREWENALCAQQTDISPLIANQYAQRCRRDHLSSQLIFVFVKKAADVF